MPNLVCPAKINLFLEVTGERADGYHDLESVFLAIDLCDTLWAEPGDLECITLSCSAPDVPVGENNIIIKAVELLRRRVHAETGIHFHLEKRIPSGGGLGGGSSDAAAALRLANQVWDAGLSVDALAEIGAAVGSDVPFFFYGGLCLCRGRGEIVIPLRPFSQGISLGLVLTDMHSSTAAAFGALRLPDSSLIRHCDGFIRALAEEDVDGMQELAFNRFEETVLRAFPDLGEIHHRLTRVAGLTFHLSGSGSAMWFFGDAEEVEERVAGDLRLAELARKHAMRIVPVQAF